MKVANIINCLSDLVKSTLSITSTQSPTPKEQEVAQHLYDTLTIICSARNFHYEKDTTLDFDDNFDDYSSEEDEDHHDKEEERDKHLKDYSRRIIHLLHFSHFDYFS
jgi:hypothetical protein